MRNKERNKNRFKHKRLRNFYKVFYLGWLELRHTLFGIKYAAEFDVTDRCNLRCNHCYHFFLKGEMYDDVSIETWKSRFEGLYSGGIRFVQLMGGEPTLRMDIIELALEMFPMVYVTTNGIIKIPTKWDLKISLSIDGMKDTNDAIRGEGTFDKVVDNYKGDGRVIINMVLTRDNYRELEDVVILAKDRGFSGVLCNIYATGKTREDDAKINSRIRAKIIAELRRVRKLYPTVLLLNNTMIDWFESADHRDFCNWGENILHFDSEWNPRHCYNNDFDCSNCGCGGGAMYNPKNMRRNPHDMIRIAITKY